jgi:hypothetical protein
MTRIPRSPYWLNRKNKVLLGGGMGMVMLLLPLAFVIVPVKFFQFVVARLLLVWRTKFHVFGHAIVVVVAVAAPRAIMLSCGGGGLAKVTMLMAGRV